MTIPILQRPTVTEMRRGREPVVVTNAFDATKTVSDVDLDSRVLQIVGPCLPEHYYRRGDQTPYNRFEKHSDIIKLRGYHSQAERNRDAMPFYRQRTEALIREHENLMANRRENPRYMAEFSKIGWKAEGDNTWRTIDFVDAYKALEEFLAIADSKNPATRPYVTYEYAPEQAARMGMKVLCGIPSTSEERRYPKDSTILENIAVAHNELMYSIMAEVRSMHCCGNKANEMDRFIDGRRIKRIEPLCKHDLLQLLLITADYQERAHKGDPSVDLVYDPHERVWASVPMYLNPVPLCTPQELKDFRVYYRAATIQRPLHDHIHGGYLRDGDGNILLDKPKPLWDAEIGYLMGNRILSRPKTAMFIRQRVMDLPRLIR